MNMRARDRGIVIGEMKTGTKNRITDVPGVTVGHVTLTGDGRNTGVTVIMPSEDNMFVSKLTAACHVLNGFGKTAGLMQIEELGTIETPIALTNTLNVGLVHDALVGYMIDRCEKDGVRLRSVNPVVAECNDASLNNIHERAVREMHVREAIEKASQDFEEGAVGAGRGMTCHGLKGGIGTASRVVEMGSEDFTLGVLVLTNHGRMKDFCISGERVGEKVYQKLNESLPDKGSCIVVMATDLPLTDRQLKRVIRRASVGLARLGSFIGHGSGEVFIGFTTANRVPNDADGAIMNLRAIHEDYIDRAFRAMAEATEEAVLNSMLMAETVESQSGTVRRGLSEFM
ncbi:MAG: P1 family peptidase [Clostridia bacterium]|nr:P1 family peptidase [Clostridia bacterium]